MRDYNNGRIYTIRCLTDKTLIYVGSTIQALSKRFGFHKASSKTEINKNCLLYRTINGDWDNWYIELNQLYPCSSKEELERKEGEIQRLIGTLNERIAGRSCKEYFNENREAKTIYHKLYRENNKELIKEKLDEKIICDCGCISTKRNIARHLKTKRHAELIAVQALPQQVQVQDEQKQV
jgi:hypothetical protein